MSEQQAYRIAGSAADNGADQSRPQVLVAGSAEDNSRSRIMVAGTGSEGRPEGAAGQAVEEARRILRAAEEMSQVATREESARTGQTIAESFRRMTAALFEMNARLVAPRQGNDAPQAGTIPATADSVAGLLQGSLVLSPTAQTALLQEWTRSGTRAIERNSRAWGDLMRCRTLPDLLQWQSEVLTSNFLDWLQMTIPAFPVSVQNTEETWETKPQGRSAATVG